MTERTLRFVSPAGRKIDFRMELDQDFPADRHIIGHIGSGLAYEAEIAWLLMRTLRPGDRVIDVGANVGFFTLMMRSLVNHDEPGLSGHVWAVEPAADNLAKFHANLLLNRYENAVSVIQHPLSDKSGAVPFYLSHDDSGGHALWPPALWHENTKTQAAGFDDVSGQMLVVEHMAFTLDQFDLHGMELRLIKLDVEGAELMVLRGGRNLLKTHQPAFIVAELNWFGMEQLGTNTQQLRDFMESRGYQTFLLRRDDNVPILVPRHSVLKPPSIINILFSTEESVATAWPEVTS